MADHRSGSDRPQTHDDDGVAGTIAATLAYQVRRDHPPHRPPARRDAHPKHHGTVQAELIVDADIPVELRYGVFVAPGRRYPAWIRFSNAFRVRHDCVRDARGMAVKLLGVEGPRPTAPSRHGVGPANHDAARTRQPARAQDAARTEDPARTQDAERTQDFLMVTHAAFFAATAADFLDFPAAVSGSGSAIASGLRTLRYFFRLRPFRWRWRAFRALRQSTTRTLSPLTLRYFSQTPYRLGPHVVKFGVRPQRGPSTADRLRLFARGLAYRLSVLPFVTFPQWEYALRDELFRAIAADDVVVDFLVQRRPDRVPGGRDRVPIDDATVAWDEEVAPFVKVATIRMPRQPIDDAGIAERLAFSEHLSFTPWHTLAAHEPLGSINEARRVVYETIASLRHELNGVRRREPDPGESAADYLRSL